MGYADEMRKQEPFAAKQDSPSTLTIADWEERLPWLRAGFSTRLGGTGGGAWESLNCALHVGDNPEDVIANRRLLAQRAGFSFDAWTCAEQVHGSDVFAVTREHRGAGRKDREEAIADRDGLITNEPGIMLAAFYADCVPLWFVDPDRRAVGVAHAGWRGTVADVAGKTVEAMRRTYGSDPSRMLAAIGPSIQACCYEVDDTVIDRVIAAGGNEGEVFVPSEAAGRYRLDLSKMNAKLLAKAGILPNHIEITSYCTSCRTDLFFSHRKEKGKTGRMTAWIGIASGVTAE